MCTPNSWPKNQKDKVRNIFQNNDRAWTQKHRGSRFLLKRFRDFQAMKLRLEQALVLDTKWEWGENKLISQSGWETAFYNWQGSRNPWGSAFSWDWSKPRELSWEEDRNRVERTGKNADHTAGDTGTWHWPMANCVEGSEQKPPCMVLWSTGQFLLTRWSQKTLLFAVFTRVRWGKPKPTAFDRNSFGYLATTP